MDLSISSPSPIPLTIFTCHQMHPTRFQRWDSLVGSHGIDGGHKVRAAGSHRNFFFDEAVSLCLCTGPSVGWILASQGMG